MLIEESKRRQSELQNELLVMASTCMDETAIRKTAIKFKSLYANGFRHNYAEFFPLIVELAKEESKYSLDYLSYNLTEIRKLVEDDYVAGEKEFKGLYQPLMKLSDHINLEIGRYSYYSVSEQKVADLEQKNQMLQVELKKATTELVEARNTVSSVQTELIAVLSIFAAIVLTFSGGISLFSGVFNGIADAPIFKTVLFTLICGFVIINSIFMMMYVVGKITNRNIYAVCKTVDCSCKDEKGKPMCMGITKVRKRLPYVFWLNVAILLLMVADVLAWHFNTILRFIPVA